MGRAMNRYLGYSFLVLLSQLQISPPCAEEMPFLHSGQPEAWYYPAVKGPFVNEVIRSHTDHQERAICPVEPLLWEGGPVVPCGPITPLVAKDSTLSIRGTVQIVEYEQQKSQASWSEINQEMAELLREGKVADATKAAERALKVAVEAFGAEHPKVATSLNNLGTLYRIQGKYSQAESLYERAIAIKEKALGPEYPKVATSLNNLAGLYREQAKYTQASSLYERALSIREKTLGPEHPDVAQSLNNLALLYKTQGRFTQAESLYKRALEIWEKALGPDDPDVATVLENMAELYQKLGDKDAARTLEERAKRIRSNQ